ncbi:methionyl-tRNA formyltransferase [Humidesulfovibrio mexicanus]|uniref:Methionyl-tRNA formyltransferase n=1 Tax=Humidesulfovibrio mexicanus TaxID=147047 RepID=A0A239BVW0_9BACT|nr:hypothetical protein [Humidesulfovibrio mexicanus]SNS11293.1 methionyl-tRNA formyltransferase [Humidesulfovibrio mexicanus]
MALNGVIFLAADTARSRAYAQAMEQAGLLPAHALLLRAPADAPAAMAGSAAAPLPPAKACGLRFDPAEPVAQTLARAGVSATPVASLDMNGPEVAAALRARPESLAIFSGPGGAILRDGVLGLGKSFLHVHGGWLPDYKGSTTNYYSLLERDECGASAILMTGDIDCGPILARRRFSRPADPSGLDYVLDPLFRARVLLDALERIAQAGGPGVDHREADNTGGRTFYVMHPVLRHLAILGGGLKPCA